MWLVATAQRREWGRQVKWQMCVRFRSMLTRHFSWCSYVALPTSHADTSNCSTFLPIPGNVSCFNVSYSSGWFENVFFYWVEIWGILYVFNGRRMSSFELSVRMYCHLSLDHLSYYYWLVLYSGDKPFVRFMFCKYFLPNVACLFVNLNISFKECNSSFYVSICLAKERLNPRRWKTPSSDIPSFLHNTSN